MTSTKLELQVKLLHPEAKLPTKAHPEEDAGFDLYSVVEGVVPPHAANSSPVNIDTGIAFAIPQGYYGQLMTRSSYGKMGMRVHPGVIDSGYRGPITVLVHNLSEEPREIRKGDKVAQLLILPVPFTEVSVVDELPTSSRGEKGFGSSGR